MHLFLAVDFNDWIGPALVAIFFFVVPILRAMREAKAKQEQMKSKPEGTGGQSDEERDAARRKWEALLRGEEAQPVPWAPPVANVPEATRRAPAPQLEQPVPEAQLAGNLSPFGTQPSEDAEETTFDEERTAQVENDARLREERRRRDDFLFAEREGAPLRADVTTAIPSDRVPDVVAVRGDVERRRNVLGAGLEPGFGSRAALRRAILASEILNRPVALRTGPEEVGHVGARR